MSKDMIVEVKLNLSKFFPPGLGQIEFEQYNLRAIPSSSTTKSESVLAFNNTYKSAQGGGSYPEEEANIIAKLLSLFWDSKISKTGLRINQIDIPSEASKGTSGYPQFFGKLDPGQTDKLIKVILSLNIDLARQFIRACHAYSFGLEFIPSDPSFAFLLIVVSIECLSSQDAVIPFSELQPDKNKCERFCRFIKLYLTDDFKSEDEKNDELFTELLKTVYYVHRSGFVHGGKEVSIASVMADNLKSSYFKHSVDDKVLRTPGLGWFAKIARGSLIGFLLSKYSSSLSIDRLLLSKLADEKSGLRVKLKKDVQGGQVVTSEDIEYR